MSRRAPLACLWSGCPIQGIAVDSPEEMLSHVNTTHIEPFSSSDHDEWLCQWEGCKVYNRPSLSYQWFVKHVRQVHMKERPHKCFMNGCNVSFDSVDALQRHLQRHLEPMASPKSSKNSPSSKLKREPQHSPVTQTETPSDLPSNPVPPTSSDDSKPHRLPPPPLIHFPPDKTAPPSEKKLLLEDVETREESETEMCTDGETKHRNTQTQDEQSTSHLQNEKTAAYPYRRRRQSSLKVCIPRHALLVPQQNRGHLPWNGAHIHSEILDHKTMSVIRQTSACLAVTDQSHGCNCITLSAKVVGKRQRHGAKESEVLVRWTPSLVLDQWVPTNKFQETLVVPFSQLSPHQLSELATTCFGHDRVRHRQRKRKP